MREALRQVKPTEFEDLIALVALYRPGPMAYIPVYAKRKHGQEQVSFADPRLEPITGPTHGICIYQEQYMEIAKQLAGFSPAEADDLRKAIGKKIHSLMASLKDKFVQGCVANRIEPKVSEQLWKDMEQAQDYSFNKSHAACYALIAYRTAYLKANHPAEYMAALISSVMNTKDRVPFYVSACEEMGIEVLPPDVNVSASDFAVVEGKIRFGLNAVKNVGENAVEAIIAARATAGPFVSLWDFCERVDPQVVNKRALESLVKSGALDSTRGSRRGMLHVLEQALALGNRYHADRLTGQGSIFDLGSPDAEVDTKPVRQHQPIATEEFDKPELLALEKESLGLWVSEHPLQGVREALRRKTDLPIGELASRRDGDFVTVGGIVGAIRTRHDAQGRSDGVRPPRRPLGVDRGDRVQLRVRGGPRAPRGRQGAAREGQGRPQGWRDKARRGGGQRVRRHRVGDAQVGGTAAGGRASRRRGGHRGARRRRARLPRRGPRRGRPGDERGRAHVRAGAVLHRATRVRLLRRGEGAPRRGGGRGLAGCLPDHSSGAATSRPGRARCPFRGIDNRRPRPLSSV